MVGRVGEKVEKETKKSGRRIDGDKKIGKDGVSPGWGKFRGRCVETVVGRPAKRGGEGKRKEGKSAQNPCPNPFSR